ncbi:MAG: serine protease [Planctomycetota bacterium]|mgnify:CR=1 FL=1
MTLVRAALAAILVALAGCAAQPSSVAAPSSIGPLLGPMFCDDVYERTMEDRAAELVEAGKTRTAADLEGQLTRESCHATLPALRRGTQPLDMVYEHSVPGVLALASVAKCSGCGRFHPKSTATAFVVTADGVCASNYHVFKHSADDQHVIAFDSEGRGYPVTEILAASHPDDAAVFRIDLGGRTLIPIPLNPGGRVGSAISIISHPENNHFVLSCGIICRRGAKFGGMNGDIDDLRPPKHDTRPTGELHNPTDAEKLTAILEVSCEYGIGSSGGPVLDNEGNAIGMVSNTRTIYASPKAKKDPQMVIRTCVPAESIIKLMMGSKDAPKPDDKP